MNRISCFLVLLAAFLLIPAKVSAQNKPQRYCDSVLAVIDAMPDDTHKVGYINRSFYDELWAFDSPEVYSRLKLAARLSQQLHADTLLYSTYRNMAHFCMRANAQDYAVSYVQSALDLAEQWNDTVRMASCWGAMAKSLEMQGKPELALRYYFQALPYTYRMGDIEKIGRTHTFIGWCYDRVGHRDSAIYYCELGRKERAEAHAYDGVLSVNASLMGMYAEEKQYDKVRVLLEECILIHDTLGNHNARAGYSNWFGYLHEIQGNNDSALWYYKKGYQLADSTGNVEVKKDYAKVIATLLEKMGRPADAFVYYKIHARINDSLKDVKARKDLARAREIYDVEAKNNAIEKLEHDNEIAALDLEKKQRQTFWLIAIIGVTVIMVVVALFAYRQKRNSAIKLREQKQIIEEKNQDITDSIRYAKRIQQAILPSLQQVKAALPESFVLFRPKDIVSGDFFWFNETPSSYYLAAVDCTGHGVPGAMMSMIGYNFLGQIVNEKDVEQPADILNELHRKVLLALNKDFTSHEIKDGMDVALLRIDKKTGKIYFSGAVRPLYIVQNGELTVIKGDIYSIGGIKDVQAESFSQHEIDAKEGTCLYIFSDGYADQFGGPRGKKYKYSQLKTLLVKNAERPMQDQFAAIERAFDEWKGPHEQVDDVCVVGLKITGPGFVK